MTKISGLRLGVFTLCLLAAAGVSSGQSAQVESLRKYDEFVEYNCEDLMARLDNYAIALQMEPKLQAYVVSYGGDFGLYEARRWAVAAKDYLTTNRGIEAKRVVTLYGGRRARWAMQLWLTPEGYRHSAAGTQNARPKGVRFKRVRLKSRPCEVFF